MRAARSQKKEPVLYGLALGRFLTKHFANPPYKSRKLVGRYQWTRKLFADAVGVSAAAVGQWERGLSLPTQFATSVVKELFGPDPEEFKDEREEFFHLLDYCKNLRDGKHKLSPGDFSTNQPSHRMLAADRPIDISHAAVAIVSDVVPALELHGELAKATKDQMDRIEDLIRNAAFMAKAADIGLTTDQVRNLLHQFGWAGAPIEQAERLLLNAAHELREVREQLTRLSNDDPDVIRLRAEALAAIERADLDEAKTLLLKAVDRDEASIDELKDVLQNRRLSAAGSLGQAARISSAQASFRNAAELFGRAARISEPVDIHIAWWHWIDAASAHAFHASVFPGFEDAKAAVEIVERHNMPLAKQSGDATLLQRARYELAYDLKILAERVAPHESIPLLRRALTVACEALSQLTPDSSSGLWLSARGQIGYIQLGLGHALAGEEGVAALREAVCSFRIMLEIVSRNEKECVEEYQGSLAVALRALSSRVGEPESDELLNEAIYLYQQIIMKLKNDPKNTSLFEARINLSGALFSAVERSGVNRATALLHAALEEIESALETTDAHLKPMNWALAMGNKAVLLRNLAEIGSEDESANNIRAAIRAYHAILSIYTPFGTPIEWIRTHNNLGTAHYALSLLDDHDDEKELQAAEAAFYAALDVISADSMSALRATVLNNLGLVLRGLANKESDTKEIAGLEKSIECHKSALGLRSQKTEPLDWAAATVNLALSEHALGSIVHDAVLMEKAAARMTSAIQFYHEQGYSALALQGEEMLSDMRND